MYTSIDQTMTPIMQQARLRHTIRGNNLTYKSLTQKMKNESLYTSDHTNKEEQLTMPTIIDSGSITSSL